MTNLLTLEQRHERAERRVTRFVGRFESFYHDMVCHAALPLILTPELVSYLRNEFLREVPWIAEVDLLLSDLCSPVGYELYVMDADVRAYVLAEGSATFTAERRREVANLLISYVRYLAEHQSYLSDRELESQQWAAMLYLGETERQTVVSELVERFQSAETGGAMVGANLLDNAEIARLAQLTQTLKLQLADYPELIEYAALVNDVQLRNITLERTRIEKTYVVAPGQFLRLPAALQTELVAKNRIQDEAVVTQPVAPQPVEFARVAIESESPAQMTWDADEILIIEYFVYREFDIGITEATDLSDEAETLEITDIPNDIEALETASPLSPRLPPIPPPTPWSPSSSSRPNWSRLKPTLVNLKMMHTDY
ncbi:MAG: hypothetical protein HC929_14070 [Leptolyngbyaceae cyanobacterium SM2_5_2]|nr:hypothetical protein [Leptolyngbyaceae cyanobacterium SM2_5_2]